MIAVGIGRHSRLFFALFASNVCCRLPSEEEDEDEDEEDEEDAEVVTQKRPQGKRVQATRRPLLPLPVALQNLVVGLVVVFAEEERKKSRDGSSS